MKTLHLADLMTEAQLIQFRDNLLAHLRKKGVSDADLDAAMDVDDGGGDAWDYSNSIDLVDLK